MAEGAHLVHNRSIIYHFEGARDTFGRDIDMPRRTSKSADKVLSDQEGVPRKYEAYSGAVATQNICCFLIHSTR